VDDSDSDAGGLIVEWDDTVGYTSVTLNRWSWTDTSGTITPTSVTPIDSQSFEINYTRALVIPGTLTILNAATAIIFTDGGTILPPLVIPFT